MSGAVRSEFGLLARRVSQSFSRSLCDLSQPCQLVDIYARFLIGDLGNKICRYQPIAPTARSYTHFEQL